MDNNSIPNFLLVGAMKCGTSSLYHYLNEHPQIYLPDIKEPKLFISSTFLKKEELNNVLLKHNTSAYVHNFNDYKRLYSKVKYEIAIGEATPHYLFTYQTTIPLIKKYLGDIKIIIILRNPINRAFSAYKHNRRYNTNTNRFNEDLSFIHALKMEEARIQKRDYPLMFFYKNMGLYYNQVKSYKDNFSQVLVCKYEDLVNDQSSLMNRIYTFLEVDNNFKPNLEVKYNVAQSSINVNFIHKTFLNLSYSTRRKIMIIIGNIIGKHNLGRIINYLVIKDESKPDEQSTKYLKKEFKEDVLKLEKLINQDLHEWLK